MPDVSRVVGGGEPSPIEASVVGGDSSNVATFDLEDDGIVLPNLTVDGFGTIDEACRKKIASINAEVIDFRPVRTLPKYRVVLPDAGINPRSDDGSAGIDVTCGPVDSKGIKVAGGAVDRVRV